VGSITHDTPLMVVNISSRRAGGIRQPPRGGRHILYASDLTLYETLFFFWLFPAHFDRAEFMAFAAEEGPNCLSEASFWTAAAKALNSGSRRPGQTGALSFAYFSLGTQRKVWTRRAYFYYVHLFSPNRSNLFGSHGQRPWVYKLLRDTMVF